MKKPLLLLQNCVGTAAHVARSSRARSARAALVRATSVITMPQFHAKLVTRSIVITVQCLGEKYRIEWHAKSRKRISWF
jgi:hypothetical protein